MTGPGHRFDPAELADEQGGISDAERLASLRTARELEAMAARDTRMSDAFVDHVMAAVETEPTPQPTVALGSALRRGRLAGTVAAIRDSFRVAFGPGRPLAVRGQALALAVAVLVGAVGLGGGATVGALNALLPDETPQPSPTEVLPTPTPSSTPAPTVSPSPSPSPTQTVGPTDTPEPTETAEGTDDHGGDRTERPGDDSSGSGSGSGSNSGSGSSSSGSGSSDSSSDDDDHGSGHDETPEPTDEPDDD